MLRVLAVTTVTAALLGALTASAALLPVDADDLTVFVYPANLGSVLATIDIDPDTLNLKSHGRWVTGYIELPDGDDVGNIDVSTVRLCLGQVTACPEDASVPAQEHPCAVGDYDGDTVPDRRVKFDRGELIELLAGQTGEVMLTVAGMVTPPGEPFAGSDTIRVIDHECPDGVRDAPCEDEEADEEPLEPTPTPEGTPEGTAPPPNTSTPLETAPMAEAPAVQPPAVLGQALAVPASPTPPPVPIATVEYLVRPGERLSDVAAFFGTTVEAIVALNALADPNLVVAGQRLIVPAPPANTAPGRVFMSGYVVRPGETLTDIAARFGTTVEALAFENALANPSAIRIGDHLRVP